MDQWTALVLDNRWTTAIGMDDGRLAESYLWVGDLLKDVEYPPVATDIHLLPAELPNASSVLTFGRKSSRVLEIFVTNAPW